MKDKVAVVTASGTGIGFASAVKMAENGAVVYILDYNREMAEKNIKSLSPELQSRMKFVQYDALDKDSYSRVFNKIGEEASHIDILVNNFGTTDVRKDLDIRHIDCDFYLETVNKNLASVLLPIQLCLPYMTERGGSIVNIASVAAAVPDISQLAYSTAKAGIVHITKQISIMEMKNKIRCNAVLPGMTMTQAVKNNLTEEFKKFFLRHIPAGRGAEPEEVAEAVYYFASDASKYTTGQALVVSGGFGNGTPLYADVYNAPTSR